MIEHGVLVRHSFLPPATLGTLYLGAEKYAILEPPWKDNRTNVSCIPQGVYQCDFLARSGSGKYKRVWWLRAVPGRTAILIHAGNYPRHTWGCLLIGGRHGTVNNTPAVLSSRAALRRLRDQIGRNPFELTIIGGPADD